MVFTQDDGPDLTLDNTIESKPAITYEYTAKEGLIVFSAPVESIKNSEDGDQVDYAIPFWLLESIVLENIAKRFLCDLDNLSAAEFINSIDPTGIKQ